YLEPAKLVGWMAQRKSQPTLTLMDEEGTAGKAYGARTTPHMYIVNPQGQLVYAGGIDSIPSSNADDIKKAVNYVKQGLGEALAGKPISAATTRPYGCSIKYKS
ncbi:MAG: thioredoxin family protein, partial [Comamonadaceae bacterium]